MLDGLLKLKQGYLSKDLNKIILGRIPEYPIPGSASLAELSVPTYQL